MTKFNQALLAAVSSVALFGGALTLITPSAEAYGPITYSEASRQCDGTVSTQRRGSVVYVCVSPTGQTNWVQPAADALI